MLRIGYMEYANVYPIFHHLLKDETYSFLRGVPAELNVAMREGRIDVSPSSSVEFARNPNLYRVVPGISISSCGPVKSVNLISKMKVEDLDGKKVYFTKESNTSTVLCRIILEKFYKITPQYVSIEDGADAKLLIGDKALHAYYNRADGQIITDLGKEWFSATGLPFVFALWIVRHEAAERSDFGDFIKKLHGYSSKSNGYSTNLIEKYVALGYTEAQIKDYWDIIDYRLTDDHLKGLKLFYNMAAELGEAEPTSAEAIEKALIKY